ncbi:MAG: aspartate--tRNA ligase [Proteobacteria bacterium]|nr:aspartate--tRNA ligase [Pseudomonadota bacterium]
MSIYRTHTCGELTTKDVGQTVSLSGWIYRRRDHGGVAFIDLRDHYGVTQIVFHPDCGLINDVTHLTLESVVKVTGVVVKRDAAQVNPNMATGDIELEVKSMEILSKVEKLPWALADDSIPEDLRLKYRMLDLRRERLQHNLKMRSDVIAFLRRKMWDNGFREYQTPILTSSSPEGARDFLVPSRLNPGKFYALPQAPQQFKQLLMVAGYDRYFQIAPCFRDEDPRADRSPGEFYQLDMEMSFVTQDDIFAVMEDVIGDLFRHFADGKEVVTGTDSKAFTRIPFDEALMKYGSDKPDLRNPLVVQNVADIFEASEFTAFKGVLKNGGHVRAIPAPKAADKPRSWFDKLVSWATTDLGAGGLGYITCTAEGEFKGPIAKFLSDAQVKEIFTRCGMGKGDVVFFMACGKHQVMKMVGPVRTKLAEELDLIDKNQYRLCWIVDFPMYEYDEDNKKVDFSHNPFSMPQGGMEALEGQDPLTIKAFQYDLVCNGYEISSGAIRNHRPEVMYKAFEIAGYSAETVDAKFGGMINAFKLGAPPHGGNAPGIDRIVMILCDEPNIREVIAFPLNGRAQDLMMGAPSEVSEQQLRELNIRHTSIPGQQQVKAS